MRWNFSIFCSQPPLVQNRKIQRLMIDGHGSEKKRWRLKKKQVFLLLLNVDFYQRSPEMVQCSGFGRFRSPISTSPKLVEKTYQFKPQNRWVFKTHQRIHSLETIKLLAKQQQLLHLHPMRCHLFLLIPKAVMAAQQVIPVDTSRSNEQCSASQIRIKPAASPGPLLHESHEECYLKKTHPPKKWESLFGQH